MSKNKLKSISIAVALLICIALPAQSIAGLGQISRVPVQLTLDPKLQAEFAQETKDALYELSGSNLAKKLCLQLIQPESGASTGAQQVPGFCTSTGIAQVQIYAAVNGHLIASYTTDGSALDRPTSAGSVAKMIGLWLIARSGGSADEYWCPQAHAGIHNADGFAGVQTCTKASLVDAATAVATSNNLAMIWRISQLDASWVRRELASIGITNVPTDHHPAAAVATGVIESTPRLIVTLMSAVVNETLRHPVSLTIQPHFSALAMSQFQALQLGLAEPGVRLYLQTLLRQPIAHSRGTARHMAGTLSANAIAKTGTPTSGDDETIGKFFAFATQRPDGEWGVGLVAVQSPTQAQMLGKKISGADFAPLHKVAARATLRSLSPVIFANN